MNNSGDAESDSLIRASVETEVDWDMIDWDAHIKEPPAPKKVGRIKAIFKYIGRSKPIT